MSWFMEKISQEEEDLITIQVPEDSLILTPDMREEDCEMMLNLWLKQRKC